VRGTKRQVVFDDVRRNLWQARGEAPDGVRRVVAAIVREDDDIEQPVLERLAVDTDLLSERFKRSHDVVRFIARRDRDRQTAPHYRTLKTSMR
jgi:uncharacterized protein (DUF2336 family)